MMKPFIFRLLVSAAFLASLTTMLTACSTTAPAAISYYDFGATLTAPAKPAACDLPPVNLSEIASPNALDSNLMLYRLLYDNDQQSRAYANHRWTMAPAQLLSLRIKSQLADGAKILDSGIANPGGWQLRLDLIDFGQYFDDATHSHAQLQLRATLLHANNLIAQTAFTQRANADSADAPGGARAMRVASDALIGDLSAWLCKQPRP
jgi:cholesterol transport system auxiliary component